jgi:hypothetical protein
MRIDDPAVVQQPKGRFAKVPLFDLNYVIRSGTVGWARTTDLLFHSKPTCHNQT